MAAKFLSEVEVRNAKPTAKPRKLGDGNGLTLLIHPNGSKYFQLRFTLHGKEKTLQLGIYPDLGLAAARNKADEARKLVKAGIDPVFDKKIQAEKIAAESATTFQAVAEQWLAIKNKNGMAQSSFRKIAGSFAANLYPRLGGYPIRQITYLMVQECLLVMEARGSVEYMVKTRSWIKAVFDYAITQGFVETNVIQGEDITLAKPQSENFPHLKTREDTGNFLRNLTEYGGRAETRLAIWLQLLVATRPGELRFAAWAEFDLAQGLWTIPKARMKNRHSMTDNHAIPLSRQAVAALKQLQGFTGYTQLLFPSVNDASKPMSDATLTKALRSIWPNYRIVPHGFRHLFSTMANEHGQFRPDVIEAALAHKDSNAIRGTYNKATYFKERQELAQWWADELEAMRDGGKVLPFKKVNA